MSAGGVVVDVDRELTLEPGNSRTGEIGAFNNKHRVVIVLDRLDVAYAIGAGQTSIRGRHVTADEDFSVLSQRSEQPVEAKRRSNAVAVRLDVRRYPEIAL